MPLLAEKNLKSNTKISSTSPPEGVRRKEGICRIHSRLQILSFKESALQDAILSPALTMLFKNLEPPFILLGNGCSDLLKYPHINGAAAQPELC